jgi:uncharacterized protein YjiS (DUF1127 family)
MATTTTNMTPRSNVFASMITRVHAAHTRRKMYRQTCSELYSLNDRELADIGLHRGMISSISFNGAFDSKD